VFNFIRSHQIIFQNCTILYSHQQCIKFLLVQVIASTWNGWTFSMLPFQWVCNAIPTVVSICISLMQWSWTLFHGSIFHSYIFLIFPSQIFCQFFFKIGFPFFLLLSCKDSYNNLDDIYNQIQLRISFSVAGIFTI